MARGTEVVDNGETLSAGSRSEGELPTIVAQIADAYVSEVDCFVQPCEAVLCGQKLGLIRMGSQCDLFVPDQPGVALDCQPGQRAYAGKSILGREIRRTKFRKDRLVPVHATTNVQLQA